MAGRVKPEDVKIFQTFFMELEILRKGEPSLKRKTKRKRVGVSE